MGEGACVWLDRVSMCMGGGRVVWAAVDRCRQPSHSIVHYAAACLKLDLQRPLTPLFLRQADEFELQWTDLGNLYEIIIGHDGSGRGPSWHLEQVEITDTKTGQVGRVFEGGRVDSDCGGAIVVSHRSCLSWHLGASGYHGHQDRTGAWCSYRSRVDRECKGAIVVSRRSGVGNRYAAALGAGGDHRHQDWTGGWGVEGTGWAAKVCVE